MKSKSKTYTKNKAHLRIDSSAINAIGIALGLTFLLAIISFFLNNGNLPAGEMYNPVRALLNAVSANASGN